MARTMSYLDNIEKLSGKLHTPTPWTKPAWKDKEDDKDKEKPDAGGNGGKGKGGRRGRKGEQEA